MSQFTCPFCKGKLVTYGSFSLLCTTCRTFTSKSSKRVELTDKSPAYLKESVTFLEKFKEASPVLVLSKAKLYEPDFVASETMFFGSKKIVDGVICNSIDGYKNIRNISDYHLIAGQGQIADQLVNRLKFALLHEADQNPMLYTEYPEPGRILWEKTLFASVPQEFLSQDKMSVLQAYFQPTLEGMIHTLLINGGWAERVHLSPLSDEQALYSWIFCEPYINVGWGKGFLGLQDKLWSYVKAILSDLHTINLDKQELPTMDNKWMYEYADVYYRSMPSTAVNCDGGEIFTGVNIAFDILNHELTLDGMQYAPTDGAAGAATNGHFRAYTLFAQLFDKYCVEQKAFGMEAKNKFMNGNKPFDLKCNTNEFILEFWQRMKVHIS